jgi:L-asparaginase II
METLPGRVFAKTGAEGGFALALPGSGLGVALKIEDGASRALGPAIIQVLRDLEILTADAEKALASFASPPILAVGKRQVGEVRAAFSLGREAA